MANTMFAAHAEFSGGLTEAQCEALVDTLSKYGAAVGAGPNGYGSIQLSLAADSLRQASDLVLLVVADALNRAEIRGEVVAVEVMANSEFERRLSNPTVPPLLDSSGIAELLGVSRQRVLKIAEDHADFPPVVAEVGRAQLRVRAAVEAWARRWERKRTGRPAAT